MNLEVEILRGRHKTDIDPLDHYYDSGRESDPKGLSPWQLYQLPEISSSRLI
jgi:hypothetical protein